MGAAPAEIGILKLEAPERSKASAVAMVVPAGKALHLAAGIPGTGTTEI